MKEGTRQTSEQGLLRELKDSVGRRLEALGTDLSGAATELREIHSALVTYHQTLDAREKSMQGALVNLVDDMSQTSQTLDETGTRLDTILEAAKDVAFVIARTEDGAVIEFSTGAETIFQYEPSEILGRHVCSLFPDEEGCALDEQSSRRLIMIRKSGAEFPAMCSSNALVNRNGEVTATLYIVLDVSRQEMAEQLIRESNERYMTLAMSSPVSIITFDDKGTISFVNDWHMRMVDQGHHSVDYFLGKKLYDNPGIVRAGVADKVRKAMDGESVSLEDVYVPPFGGRDEAWVNIRIAPMIQNGVQTGGILIREDVTRRKRTENDLQQLIDSSPIPLLKLENADRGKIIRYLNPEAVAMFGQQALGKVVDDYVTVVDEEEAGVKNLHGDPCEVQTTDGVRKAIRTTHASSSSFEVQAVMDVSVLVAAKEAAEDASRAKSDFLANISHEIRTPLNVLLGMLQLFEEEDLGEEMNQMIEYASGAGNSLLALLNDILDFSVVEARALYLDETTFNVREVLEMVATPYRMEAQNKGVDLACVMDSALPESVWGDARRLRQIVFHVVGNAVKFTDSGSILMEAGWIPGGGPDQRGVLEILVSDTGIGMSPEQVDVIFEPFRQADGSRNRRHGGTGIGLALVSEFVRAMGGEICVESTPDKGTQFRFTVLLGLTATNPVNAVVDRS